MKPLATALLSEPLALPMELFDIDFTAKPTEKLIISHETIAAVMQNVNYLLDTGAGVNVVRSSVLPLERMDSPRRVQKSSNALYRHKRTTTTGRTNPFTSPPRKFLHLHIVQCSAAFFRGHLIWCFGY